MACPHLRLNYMAGEADNPRPCYYRICLVGEGSPECPKSSGKGIPSIYCWKQPLRKVDQTEVKP